MVESRILLKFGWVKDSNIQIVGVKDSIELIFKVESKTPLKFGRAKDSKIRIGWSQALHWYLIW